MRLVAPAILIASAALAQGQSTNPINGATITPACVAPRSSGGNVDVSISNSDSIDFCAATCGGAGNCTTQWNGVNLTIDGGVCAGGGGASYCWTNSGGALTTSPNTIGIQAAGFASLAAGNKVVFSTGADAIGFSGQTIGAAPTGTYLIWNGSTFNFVGGGLAVNGVAVDADWSFSAPLATATAATGSFAPYTVINAGTFRSANFTTRVIGAGAGNQVIKLCKDGTACAAGNTFCTVTQSCTTAVGTTTACTAGAATTYAAAATLTPNVTTACATTNEIGDLIVQLTTP